MTFNIMSLYLIQALHYCPIIVSIAMSTYEELCHRLMARDETLREFELDFEDIGYDRMMILSDLLCHNTTLTKLSLYGADIQNVGGRAMAMAHVLRHNSTLKILHFAYNDIGDEGAIALANSLRENSTLTDLNLTYNNIGDEGAIALADSLRENTTLTDLDLYENSVSCNGAMAFAECLHDNSSLIDLYLNNNNIGNDGAKALAEALHHNSSLKTLGLCFNEIGNDGERTLSDSLCHNTTITSLTLWGNGMDEDIWHHIDAMVGWNRVGALSPDTIVNLPSTCKDRVLAILLVLNVLPICDDMHWIIMSMLMVKDIVNSGKPWERTTWK